MPFSDDLLSLNSFVICWSVGRLPDFILARDFYAVFLLLFQTPSEIVRKCVEIGKRVVACEFMTKMWCVYYMQIWCDLLWCFGTYESQVRADQEDGTEAKVGDLSWQKQVLPQWQGDNGESERSVLVHGCVNFGDQCLVFRLRVRI